MNNQIENSNNSQVILPFPLEYNPRHKSEDIMLQVMIAMLPAIMIITMFTGVGVLIQLVLATITACCCELLNGALRKTKVIKLYLYSSIVSAWILAVSIPAYSPWWIIVVGCCFGLLFGKHLFGGIGMNIFNPAIVGFCFLYVSFAYYMSFWVVNYVDISTAINAIFQLKATPTLDAIAGATLLGNLKVGALQDLSYQMVLAKHQLVSFYSVSVVLAWCAGGLFLIWQKAADWRLSIFSLLSFSAVIIGFHWANPQANAGIVLHLLNGTAFFAAFFVITDPVTAATSAKGRIIFAILVGFLAAIIRLFSNMPDSWAFAILLGNICVPLIDQYTRPSYGEKP